MKQIFRLNKFILAALLTAGITASCVEQEQNPFEEESTNNNETTIDAKLPNPNAISFYVGDEVIIKGYGFSNNDEIYLRNMEYEYGEDVNGDGMDNSLNIKAEIKEASSDRLVFIVPEETCNEYYMSVYLNRSGNETRLGETKLESNIFFDSNNYDESSCEFSIMSYDKPLNMDGKLYLQYYYIDETNGKIELTGHPIYIKEEHIVREEHMISARYEHGLGNPKVIYEVNGERIIVGELYFPEYGFAHFNEYNISLGQEYFVEWGGFNEYDTLSLTDYEYEYFLQITRIEDNGAYFIIPENWNNYLEKDKPYTLYMRRGGKMFIISESVYINK